MRDIPAMWQRFITQNIADRIPNRLDQDIIAMYTQYEGDYTQPYTFFLGCKVANLALIPQDMERMTVPAANYVVWLAKGRMPDCIIEAWQNIWHAEPELERIYRSDFEIYSAKSQDPNNAEVEIYIGTRKPTTSK